MKKKNNYVIVQEAKTEIIKVNESDNNSDDSAEKSDEKNVAQQEEPQKIDFDTWFIVRSKQIPAHHHKEIIKADFKARNLPTICTMDQFDGALEKYGLKLN